MAYRSWRPAGGGHPGDYFNVVGLPLCRLGQMLSQFGVELLAGKEEQKL